jgi:amino acid permease
LIGLDPVDQVYTWLAGACTVAFVILLAGTTASVLVFFNGQRRRGELRESELKVIYVPIVAFIFLIAIFLLVMVNLLELTGGSVLVASSIMLILGLAFILGVLLTYMRPSIRLDVDEDLGYADS